MGRLVRHPRRAVLRDDELKFMDNSKRLTLLTQPG
jgi:hypothetical protein